MDDYRTVRFEMFEVWEDGRGEFPLFVTSDPVIASDHVKVNPTDTITRRWWVREGGLDDVRSTPGIKRESEGS